MFTNLTTRDQGDLAVALAIFMLQKNKYKLSIPLTDNQFFDLVIEKDKKLSTVQVKSTKQLQQNGFYVVELKRVRSNTKTNTLYHFNNEDVDFVCVVAENSEVYLIPSSKILVKNSLTLSDKFSKFRLE